MGKIGPKSFYDQGGVIGSRLDFGRFKNFCQTVGRWPWAVKKYQNFAKKSSNLEKVHKVTSYSPNLLVGGTEAIKSNMNF